MDKINKHLVEIRESGETIVDSIDVLNKVLERLMDLGVDYEFNRVGVTHWQIVQSE